MERCEQKQDGLLEKSGSLFLYARGLNSDTFLLALFNYLSPNAARLNAEFDFEVARDNSKSDA